MFEGIFRDSQSQMSDESQNIAIATSMNEIKGFLVQKYVTNTFICNLILCFDCCYQFIKIEDSVLKLLKEFEFV